jgi:hypothetical protein
MYNGDGLVYKGDIEKEHLEKIIKGIKLSKVVPGDFKKLL